MSRRTKLIILALFLVLAGIPSVHIAITWHPENPLRFRSAPDLGTPIAGGDNGEIMVPLTIENTSRAPVHLLLANVWEPNPSSKDDGGLGLITPEIEINAGIITSPEYLLIPPRSETSCIVLLDPVRYARLPRGLAQVEYLWTSRLKYQFIEAMDRLRIRLSTKWGRFLPVPSIGQNQTSLQLPPPPAR